MPKVLVVATSRRTRGGITSVIKAHETGPQWKKYRCTWIETHRDCGSLGKILYLVRAVIKYLCLLPFTDVVHIHVGLKTSVLRKMLFAKIARVFGKPIILHFHPATEKHLFDPAFSGKIKRLFDCSDRLIVLSPQWVKWIDAAYPENKYDMRVIYNPCPIVKRVSPSKKKKYILFAGTLNERKGYNRLLEAFAKVAQQFPDWRLVFAGNGNVEEARKLQKKLGIADAQVEYLGWVSGEAKNLAFQQASIYCLPSWGEGFPMGVLDAIAYGVAIVTTPVGGIVDVMHHGKNCLIYETYDIDALSKCLVQLMSSEYLRQSMVNNADKLRDYEFNINYICEQIGNVYAELSKT